MQTPKIMMISHLDIEFMSYTTFPQCRINNNKTLVKNIETVTKKMTLAKNGPIIKNPQF